MLLLPPITHDSREARLKTVKIVEIDEMHMIMGRKKSMGTQKREGRW